LFSSIPKETIILINQKVSQFNNVWFKDPDVEGNSIIGMKGSAELWAGLGIFVGGNGGYSTGV
jgi:hypothetical protein